VDRLDASTPVVVLRCSRHGGLGITRTLGRMGVPIYHVDASNTATAFHSRYSRGRFVWDTEKATPVETVAFLTEVASSIGRRAILIPTSDATAMLVADHAETLGKHFDFPCNETNLVRSLCSKREMYTLVKRHGIPTAETAFPESRDEMMECSSNMQFPIMAKGIFATDLERTAGKRMFLVPDRRSLIDLWDAHRDHFRSNFILQEFIPGATDACWIFNGYFDRNSESRAEFTGRKLRQYPADGGLTSLGECARNETIARMTRNLVQAVGYRGVLDIDYRYDARDGQYKVLDINPRVGATFRLFVGASGMDVVRAMYLDLTRQPVEPAPAPEGRRWMVEDCDLMSSLHAFRNGKLALRDWLKSYRGVAETGIFAIDDPLPAFWTLVRNVQKLWHPKSHQPQDYQASRLVMLTRKRGLERSDSSIW
jgi:D-aspartate ligase